MEPAGSQLSHPAQATQAEGGGCLWAMGEPRGHFRMLAWHTTAPEFACSMVQRLLATTFRSAPPLLVIVMMLVRHFQAADKLWVASSMPKALRAWPRCSSGMRPWDNLPPLRPLAFPALTAMRLILR